jgi:hypothetical protein
MLCKLYLKLVFECVYFNHFLLLPPTLDKPDPHILGVRVEPNRMATGLSFVRSSCK